MGLKTYLLNVAVALDRLVNALQRGDPNETLSSVAYRKHRDGARFGFMARVIDTIFRNPTHCEQSYKADRTRVLPK